MIHTRTLSSIAVGAALLLSTGTTAFALPTMVRLGYNDCAACHVSPQGGGLLNAYGRGIDEAQSLRGGEYRPSQNPLMTALDWGGRISQDLRLVMVDQRSWASHQTSTNIFRPRLLYRNVTNLSSAVHVSATVTGETVHAPRPSLSYDPASRASTLFVNTALLHVRATRIIEIAAGRDQLPTGINVPDPAAFIKSRNRLGAYDAPAQIKVFLQGGRWYAVPFVFGSSGNEAFGEREHGAGALVEVDLLGHRKTVVGATLLHGNAPNGNRRTAGAYARLGFGSWGILAEHDLTEFDREAPLSASFGQQTSYGQLFWAAREWFVASGTGERVSVDQPFSTRLIAGKIEIAARLTNQASLNFNTRIQRDEQSKRLSHSATLQLTFKTAQ